MRRQAIRRLRALPGGATQRRVSDTDRFATIARELAEEAGDKAAELLRLVERRAPSISASESAAFILQEWRKDGPSRVRILAMAAMPVHELEAERALSKEIALALRAMAGAEWGELAEGQVRANLVRYLRAQQMKFRIPAIVTLTEIERAAASAVTMTDHRMAISMTPILRLFSGGA